MANLLNFIENNVTEVIIGLAVGIIIAILAGLDIKQGLTLIVLSSLSALILKQLLSTVEILKQNQTTALTILMLIGGFFVIQYFQLGIFSVQNINTQPQAFNFPTKAISGLPNSGIFAIIGGIFFVLMRIPGLGLFLGPIFLLLTFIFFGVPFFAISIAIFQNFKLILIMFSLIALAFIVFKTKRIRAVTS